MEKMGLKIVKLQGFFMFVKKTKKFQEWPENYYVKAKRGKK